MPSSHADPTPPRAGACARARIVALVLVLVAGAVVADAVYRAGPNQRTDLPVYLAGSARILSGADPLGAQSSRGWPYVYPPTLAVLLAPLTPLPIRWSAGLWCALSLGLLGAALWRWPPLPGVPAPGRAEELASAGAPPSSEPTRRSTRPEGPSTQASLPDAKGPSRPGGRVWELWLPLAMIALPALSALLRGQVGPLLLALGLWAWCDLRAKRDLRAGVLLALAAAIKLTPVFVLAGLLAARRWRALGGAALGLCVFLVLLPLPFLGPRETASSLAHFGEHMIVRPLRDPGNPNMTSLRTDVPNNQSLTSLASRHLEGLPRALVFGLLALGSLGVLIRAAWRLDLASYGLLWGVPLLVAPVAWHHHHVVAFFALAALGARRSRVPLGLFALLALAHFAIKDARPLGLLALGTLILLVASALTRDPAQQTASSQRS